MVEYYNLDKLDGFVQKSLNEYEKFFKEVILNETGYKFDELDESNGINIKFDSDDGFVVENIKQAAGTGMVFIDLTKNQKDITLLLHNFEQILICFGYIKTLEIENSIYSDNSEKSLSRYMSKNGSKGANIKNEPMRKLKAFAINLAKEYPLNNSANKIAFEIKNTVYMHGRTINANLSQHNAQDTIKKWINESKSKKLGG